MAKNTFINYVVELFGTKELIEEVSNRIILKNMSYHLILLFVISILLFVNMLTTRQTSVLLFTFPLCIFLSALLSNIILNSISRQLVKKYYQF